MVYGDFIPGWTHWYFHWFLQLTDIYTNFLCLVLCLKMYSNHYHKICKCLDIKCRKCWTMILQNNEETNTLKPIHIQLASNTVSIPSQQGEDTAGFAE